MRRYIGNDEGEMDRILSREEEILPSSGFALSVMDAVRREAAAPPPIPFPWRRALPGLVVGIGAVALVLVAIMRAIALLGGTRATHFSMSVPSVPSLFNAGIESAAIWTALAMLTAFVSVKISMRLFGTE